MSRARRSWQRAWTSSTSATSMRGRADQARALRRLAETRPNAAVDLPHLIEEVEGLGRASATPSRSHLRTIIEHCLKLACSPASEPRAGWTLSGRSHPNGDRGEADTHPAARPADQPSPTVRSGTKGHGPRASSVRRARGGGCPAGALPVDARRAAAGGAGGSGEEGDRPGWRAAALAVEAHLERFAAVRG